MRERCEYRHGAPSALPKLAVGALVLVALLACDDTSDDPVPTPTVPAGFFSALPTIEPPIVGDRPGFEIELVPTPEPTSADALTTTPATGAADQFTLPERVELKHPKLGSTLDGLIARIEAGDVSPEAAAQEAPLHQGGSVAVTIHLSGNVDDVVRFLETNGGSTIGVGEDYIEALVPVLLLGQAAEQPGVLRVRLIQPPESSQNPSGVAGNGPEAHGSPPWNQAGYTGQGIKVGIIDGGFRGFSDLMGAELPQTVVARCYQLVGQSSENLADCEDTTTDHGTEVAESIMDIAPDVTLYIAQVSTPGTVKEAAKWMVDEGVDVINFSASMPFDGPGNGTSPSSDSPLNTVDLAVDSGVLWVNAAGNYAQKTWFQRGPYSDPDDDGIINFTTLDEGIAVFLGEGRKVVELRWDDSWGGATRDLDLALYNARGTRVLLTADPQSGGGGHIPHERMIFTVRSRGVYSIAVIHRSGSVPDWIQLVVKGSEVGPIQYHTGIGSIGNPAESANPGMLAVGAAHHSDLDSIEEYSSRGPTPDGRVKPDVVGAACGETATSSSFCGTSQAAPHVAGMAALVRQRFPGYSPAQAVTYLRDNAEQRISSPDPNNTWGHGFFVLPQISQGLPDAPVIGSVTPGASTLTVAWSSPSSAAAAAITAYDLRHIQSNASSKADANWTVVQDAWAGTGPLQYAVTGLTNGVQYDVQVRAVNTAGDGPWSAVATGTTIASVTTPGVPGNLTATANGQTRIDLSWSAPTDDGGAAIAGYRIEVSTDGSTWSDLVANTRATSTSYSHTGLTAGSTRHYRVSASNSAGTGTASNVASATTGVAPAPDLVVDTPTVDASAPAAGARFTLSTTVRNQGNGSSPFTTLRYYRSTDPTITTGDTEVGTDSVSSLNPSGSGAETISLTAPSTPGTYYYGACVDSVSDESDTTNNCSAAVTVTVGAAPAPDLVVDTPTVDASAPAAGARFTLSATVRNQGSGSSAFTTLRYYRSTDSTITAGDTEVGTDSVSGLNPSGSSAETISLTAPSTPGTYYYGACVDAVSDESDTTNNCSAAVTLTVGAAPAPDLVVDTPTVDASAPAVGARFTLSATVRNQGSAPSASTTLRYYRSTDSTITTGDTEVGTDSVSGLNPSSISAETISLTAPSTPGTYYYGACVDTVSDESDTTNNCSPAVTVTVGAAPAPDLVVDTPTVDASAPAAGARFTLSATVRNQGNGSSAFTTLRYYRSTDPTITTGDTEVGTDAVFRLDATESGAESISLTAPSTPGTYYYGACVDTVSDESDTTNNCSTAVTVTVGAAPAPDLVVDTPTVDGSAPAAGARFTLSATVRNQGSGRSASTTLRYYRSTDSTITTGDTAVGTDSVSGLNSPGSGDESISLTAPSSPGTYYYGACVDTVSDESDTTNNCSAAVTVTVGAAPAPDLVVDTPTVSESRPTAGASFTLTATVRNQGNGPSAFTTLRYYRSTDSTITTGDTAVGTDSVSGLNSSGSGAESISLTAPSTPGTYYYGVCVDSVSGESDTTNNCSSAVTVTVASGNTYGVGDLLPGVPTRGLFIPAVTAGASLSSSGGNTTITFTNGGYIEIQDGTRYTCQSTDGCGVHNGEITRGTIVSQMTSVLTADLIVDPPTVSQSAPAAGESFTLSATVRNQGSGRSASTTLRYYRSTDSTITTGDTAVGTDSVSGLNSSGSGDESISLTAPSTPGAYYYGACVDAVTDESDTTNNCSTAVTVTVGAPISTPSPPTSLTATANGQTQIDLSWNAPSDNGGADITGYRIEVSTNGSSWTDLVTNTGNAATSYSHSGLAAGSMRHYRVSAINSAGTGAASNTANATTDPAIAQQIADGDCATGGAVPDAANNPGLVSDCEALLDAKDTLRGTATLNWSAGASISQWDGIAIGGTPRRVTWLWLFSNQLRGEIPPELGRLSNLTELLLGDNQLTGEIPPELGGLSNLEYLSLGSNRLTDEIPPELGRLSNLEQLLLADNQLTGEIPPELGGLSNLTKLRLNRNQLTGEIPPELGGLSNLTWLDLASNQLTGCIPEGLRDIAVNDLGSLNLPDCTTATAPDAPTGLSATADGQTEIDLSWTAPSDDGGEDITGYRIEVSEDGSDWSDLEANTGSGSTTYSHTGLTAGSTRHYRVSAINSAGTGPASNTANATTSLATQGSPDLVVDNTLLGANVTPGYNLSLNATVSNQGDGPSVPTTLRYYHSPDVMITTSDTQVGTDRVDRLVPSGSISHAIGVTVSSTPGTYYYGACVDTVPSESDAGNNCSTATEVTVRVVNSPPEIVGDIDDITVTLGESFQVDISGVFSEPDGEEIQDYGFTLRTSGILTGVVYTRTGILSLRAVGVGATTVAVEASDIHGNGSGPHDLFVVTVVPAVTATAPGEPTGLTATANGQTRIDLSWIAPSDNGGANIAGYKIEVSTSGSSWSDLEANTGSGSTTYSHTGLIAGSTRHYRASAINSAGTGAASDVADATTAEAPATDRTCTVHLIVRPGESCTYPGTSTEFSVDSDGNGQFLFTSSGSRIELRNTTINGVTYTFVASKQSDGNWLVEEVG